MSQEKKTFVKYACLKKHAPEVLYMALVNQKRITGLDHICYLSYSVMTTGDSVTTQWLLVLTLAQIANVDRYTRCRCKQIID